MGHVSTWLCSSLVVLCLASAGVAQAATYYVSPRGADANSGTAAKPWQSVARVNRADLRPGDRVLFEGGKTFAGTILLDAKDSGTKARRVVVSSYGKGRATINAGVGNGLVARDCSYLTVKGLVFVGAGRKAGSDGRGVTVQDGTGIEVDQVEVSGFRLDGVAAISVRDTRLTWVHAHDNGAAGIGVGGSDEAVSRNVYIGHCVAENNPGDPKNLENHSGNGIVVGYVTGCLIEYCEAFNNGWDMPRTGNGPVGMWAWHADRVTMQHCISHDNKSPGDDGGGFDLDGGLTNCLVQYNYSYNNDGPGYFLCQYPTAPEWKHNVVRYNLSVNDGGKNNRQCGFDVYGGDAGMSDAEVYHNTIYNEKGGAVGFGGMAAPGIRFRNNVFVGTGPLIRGDASPDRFEGNIYWSLDGGTFADNAKTFAEWVAATGQEKRGEVTLGRYVDPRLANPRLVALRDPTKLAALTGFGLQAGSPCLGTGEPIADNGGRDLAGTKLPKGTRPDLGAWQSSTP